MHELRIQRATEGTTSDPEDIPEPALDVVGGEGMRLESSIQRSLEDRMDADFSDVRIHTGADATKACEAIDARAFTCGNKIAFNSGEYNPESPEGQYLLAHELAHVKQQTGGAAISMMPKEGGLQIDPDPQLEREADEAAAKALSGEEPLVVNRMGAEMHIQRADKQATLDGFDEDGFDDEFVEEADESETINLWSVLKAAAAGGSLTAAAQVLVQAGLLEAGMQDPQTAGAAVGLSTAAYGLVQGYKALYKEVDPQLLRTAFKKAGKEELLDQILSMLGAEVSDHEGKYSAEDYR
ncbi:DUF4157 domain-containing protein [Natranaeroarchaeum aerophilus]|uniref:DUF4157 domain-containing protein n=1 Tax=Natranaeroarchaeum aerophilus TaxID=2917711 RepID=A0AAE3K334_9EURY|nr:DUF4157 domain-containing protein [Natranaeroarchaeum aerophilus]MCL9812051.1 DUF4157 domain-containing protein [Natranaeroarchaeum aerophilus]